MILLDFIPENFDILYMLFGKMKSFFDNVSTTPTVFGGHMSLLNLFVAFLVISLVVWFIKMIISNFAGSVRSEKNHYKNLERHKEIAAIYKSKGKGKK